MKNKFLKKQINRKIEKQKNKFDPLSSSSYELLYTFKNIGWISINEYFEITKIIITFAELKLHFK